ncbi:hypothetical protein SNE40_019870 [Patella caerulea]|uniref:PiggyBac transposable element-derived protein domain-containing protein n=1 Tax=Patella caerulea TaxID=87958 RepID=A0AAN8IZY6_PATCE
MASAMKPRKRPRPNALTLNDVVDLINNADEENCSSDSGSDIDISELCDYDSDSSELETEKEVNKRLSTETITTDTVADDSIGLNFITNNSPPNDTDTDIEFEEIWRFLANRQNDRLPVLHNFAAESGPVWNPDNCHDPVKYFDKFFESTSFTNNKSLWQFFVDETNKYYEYPYNKHENIPPRSRLHLWTPTDINQMSAFIGLIINMGLVQYWKKDFSQETPIYRNTFTYESFKLLLRCFHVSDSLLEMKKRN